jgi:multidrug efflux pump subunit AcrB
MLITFGVLTALGITLNMIVLFALALALGMLVDDAIVIVENVYRHMQEGKPRFRAALEATYEVAWPVTTSTLTNVAAFVPMLFWPGMVGKFMSYLPLTVCIVLMSSLFVAMVMNPVFCATFTKLKPGHHRKSFQDSWFALGYEKLLRLALANRIITLLVLLASLASVFIAFGRWGAGTAFFPDSEPKRCQINIKAGEGTKIEKTNDIALKVEERLNGIPDIDYVTTTVGTQGSANPLRGGSSGPNVAAVSVEFVDRHDRTQNSFETIKQIRAALADLTGAVIDVQKEMMGPPTGKEITIELDGDRVDVLAKMLPAIYARIKDVPGLVDLTDDLVASKPEIRFNVDRQKAALAGVSTTWVAQFIKMYALGIKVGTYREGDDEYDIVVRSDERFRNDLNKLLSLYVLDATGTAIPLSSLARTDFVGGFGNVQRVDEKRAVTIEGSAAEGYNANAVLAEVQKRLKDLPVPGGCQVRYRGQDEEQQKAGSFLLKAFIAALMLIAVILITEFNSLSLPFIIMAAVIMSLVGVFGALLSYKLPFSVIMTGIGVIALAGVVVKNGIVLIDYTLKLQDRGFTPREAIVKAGKTRLRPVLLTALTAMLALVPTAMGIAFNVREFKFDMDSEASQWWKNMAVSVIYGLGVATLLTLVVEPALFSMFADVRGWFKRRFKRPEAEVAAVPVTEADPPNDEGKAG